MVYGFVERSGGRIEIDSHEGEGSQIHLFLPMHDPDIAAAEADGEDVAVGDPANGGTVLLVEDQPEVREVVGNYLEILGCDVALAADAQEAFKVMAETDGKIQVVLSDMILPGGVNGVEILSRARQLVPDARLILMSGNPAVPALDGAKGLDNIPLLRKPFRKADLARVLGVDLEGP